MNFMVKRLCPICNGPSGQQRFPYAVRFAGHVFTYLRCDACHSVFVDPVPNATVFAQMYDKAAYHDVHYRDSVNSAVYGQSVDVLINHAPARCRVLDYGCGAGGFLNTCQERGFNVIGVEFDPAAAKAVAESLGCQGFTVDNFDATDPFNQVDVIHFGDVLEHLSDPMSTLKDVLRCLRPGGWLYVEGPLEVNPSPVYYAAMVFGAVKHRLNGGRVSVGTPTHLFRTHAQAQKRFFERLGPNYELVAWTMQETGWPYSGGGRVKRCIAAFSRAIGGMRLGRVTFGNRFRAVIRHRADPSDSTQNRTVAT